MSFVSLTEVCAGAVPELPSLLVGRARLLSMCAAAGLDSAQQRRAAALSDEDLVPLVIWLATSSIASGMESAGDSLPAFSRAMSRGLGPERRVGGRPRTQGR